MSIRILLCLLFVVGFSFYAWKNYFASLCAALVLMAVIQHPDMPKSIGGIQGLNPWNLLIANVTMAWWKKRKEEGFTWDMPVGTWKLFIIFIGVILWTFCRLILNPTRYLDDYSFVSALSDYWINCVKWLVVCFIFFDSCRSEARVRMALLMVVALYFLLGIQVIRWMPLSYALEGGSKFAARASKLIQNEIGYNRVTLSMILGGASWATLTMIPYFEKKWMKLGLLFVAAVITVGQALTGGRTGYFSWVLVGVALSVVRFRYVLPVIPVAVILVLTFMPAVRERIFAGTTKKEGAVQIEGNLAESTSGRTTIWPHVIRKIKEGPIIGFGRLAMLRTGLTDYLIEEENENFAHPHNAYLEQLFDNGIVGFLGVVPLLFLLLLRSLSVLMDRSNMLYTAAGGVACALLLALMLGSMGGQTFYPREGSVGMWSAIGVMLRVWVERERSRETGLPLFGQPEGEPVMAFSEGQPASDFRSVL